VPRAVRSLVRENLGANPSRGTRARCAATASGEASVRSRIACQRMAGSESSSQSMIHGAILPSLATSHRTFCAVRAQRSCAVRFPGEGPTAAGPLSELRMVRRLVYGEALTYLCRWLRRLALIDVDEAIRRDLLPEKIKAEGSHES